MGLGLSGGAWWRTVDALSRGFRVITFDNRGVGRSRGLTPAYTTEALADDAVAVLDALEIAQANVYGLSLGGMVAQQIALRHPRRVRSLVLGATTPGGRRAKSPTRRSWRSSTAARTAREEAAWASVAYNYGRRCRDEHADRIAEDIRRRLAYNFDEEAYKAQLMAAALHNCTSRLGRIKVPALVVHGEDDRVVPVANAPSDREPPAPTAGSPASRRTGHLYTTEAPEADAEVGRFFDAVRANGRRRNSSTASSAAGSSVV